MSLKQLPLTAGIGFRAPHKDVIFEQKEHISWIEIHPENFMVEGGPALALLDKLVEHFPISFHGVGLSLGSADGISEVHLKTLKRLIERARPARVSEHVSWNQIGGGFLNDLLPVPYTKEALNILSDNIKKCQDFIGCQLLVENPSSYLEYEEKDYSEAEFMAELVEKANCGILLDINNIYVSCQNHGWDPIAYIDLMPAQKVQEFHLAGHSRQKIKNEQILIDTHDHIISEPVWELYHYALQKIGARSTLIEWDQNIPLLAVLLDEAAKAEEILAPFRSKEKKEEAA